MKTPFDTLIAHADLEKRREQRAVYGCPDDLAQMHHGVACAWEDISSELRLARSRWQLKQLQSPPPDTDPQPVGTTAPLAHGGAVEYSDMWTVIDAVSKTGVAILAGALIALLICFWPRLKAEPRPTLHEAVEFLKGSY